MWRPLYDELPSGSPAALGDVASAGAASGDVASGDVASEGAASEDAASAGPAGSRARQAARRTPPLRTGAAAQGSAPARSGQSTARCSGLSGVARARGRVPRWPPRAAPRSRHRRRRGAGRRTADRGPTAARRSGPRSAPGVRSAGVRATRPGRRAFRSPCARANPLRWPPRDVPRARYPGAGCRPGSSTPCRADRGPGRSLVPRGTARSEASAPPPAAPSPQNTGTTVAAPAVAPTRHRKGPAWRWKKAASMRGFSAPSQRAIRGEGLLAGKLALTSIAQPPAWLVGERVQGHAVAVGRRQRHQRIHRMGGQHRLVAGIAK